MKKYFSHYSKYVLGLFVFILALSFIYWIGNGEFLRPSVVEAKVTQGTTEEPVVFERANPQIQAVMAVQNRHTHVLLEEPGVVGTATGLTEHGRPAILVFAKSFEAVREAAIPANLEGVPVRVKITGEIKTLKRPPGKGKPEVDRTARFDRPVPIGVSTGHPAITAGTIGCRVTDGTNVYALSAKHVYAPYGLFSIGDPVIQPGAVDGGSVGPDPDVIDGDEIGTLYDFWDMACKILEDSEIDAAIALTTRDELRNTTPSDGYGTPKSTTYPAAINLRVKKYGRTTGLTKGRVYAINATVNVVGYGCGTAHFEDLIVITPANFSAGGDSGSLMVVNGKANDPNDLKPVGLLFGASQLVTVANPIDKVLELLSNETGLVLTIDGEE